MTRLVAAVALLAGLAAGDAAAESVTLRWLGGTIDYDDAIWRAGGLPAEGSLIFTCIAADCPRRPQIHARSWRHAPAAEGGRPVCSTAHFEDAGVYGVIPFAPTGADHVAFGAANVWSGCRAGDEPILEACGERQGIAYHLMSRVGGGCNFAPGVPQPLFLGLLRGVRGE